MQEVQGVVRFRKHTNELTGMTSIVDTCSSNECCFNEDEMIRISVVTFIPTLCKMFVKAKNNHKLKHVTDFIEKDSHSIIEKYHVQFSADNIDSIEEMFHYMCCGFTLDEWKRIKKPTFDVKRDAYLNSFEKEAKILFESFRTRSLQNLRKIPNQKNINCATRYVLTNERCKYQAFVLRELVESGVASPMSLYDQESETIESKENVWIINASIMCFGSGKYLEEILRIIDYKSCNYTIEKNGFPYRFAVCRKRITMQ